MKFLAKIYQLYQIKKEYLHRLLKSLYDFKKLKKL